MYYSFRNKYLEDLPKENVRIWSCTKEGCKGWMRYNFAFEHEPKCCLCLSPMISDMRLLPLLVNSNDEWEALRKSIPMKPAKPIA
ncbi:hypothetical protein SD70_17790 [Gordoniibacillus kamchatkensis]|uniref:Cold-shock protein n=1 Tax=Gordoniibacillus kamchatkensis TaxID=1590651 RepID=A0ABR5AFE0_9BACL|nr:cold-shock protein [Paenibacillus sp. VKM B-2647]KIL39764.1 hypothetical protein SD70_17790 [Paenibacillus sp. VKM B-2647]